MHYFFRKVWTNLQKRIDVQRCFFFSPIFKRECIYIKNQWQGMYKSFFFFQNTYVKNFWYMYKISKDNVFTNFQRSVFTKFFYFFFQKLLMCIS